jgi:hypothetical protein
MRSAVDVASALDVHWGSAAATAGASPRAAALERAA